MKKILISITMIILTGILGSSNNLQNQEKSLTLKKPIELYLEFLKDHQQNPVDYVLGLFKNADIIILCERAHSEITQYNLITDIIRDKRFIEKVGHVFLEIGNYQLQPYVDSFLMNDKLTEEEVKDRLFHIIRNCSSSPLWEYTNYFNFFKDIYFLNKTLPMKEKIHIYPSNMPFSWKGMTREKYEELRKNRTRVRDKIIANQIIEKYREILNSHSIRKKALVIMNYRHAFPHLDVRIGSKEKHIDNVGGFLMKAFPGKTANVMLNSFRILEATETSMSWTALQHGKWDALFALAGNPDLGFDFKGSPFGSDNFDYFPYQKDYTYKDIFTGYVFYKPLEKHILQYGIPGIFDDAFKKEFIKRHRIKNEKTSIEEINEMIKDLEIIKSFGYEILGESDYKQLIQNWLKKKKKVVK
jgi:hypothetical protein